MLVNDSTGSLKLEARGFCTNFQTEKDILITSAPSVPLHEEQNKHFFRERKKLASTVYYIKGYFLITLSSLIKEIKRGQLIYRISHLIAGIRNDKYA